MSCPLKLLMLNACKGMASTIDAIVWYVSLMCVKACFGFMGASDASVTWVPWMLSFSCWLMGASDAFGFIGALGAS